MRIHLVTPAPPGSLHGNRITALRWQQHLEHLGHSVSIAESWRNEPAELLIALHALRSHQAIAAFHAAQPDRPVVLILTGTDLYRDLAGDAATRTAVLASMRCATRLVGLHDELADAVPAEFHHKLVVIHQSVPALLRQPHVSDPFLVSVIGHLRDEKDPFCIVHALRQLPPPPQAVLQVVHLGKAMDERHRLQARQAMQDDPRYQWLGELPHAAALQWLVRSDLMVISSRMEGGAHVVSEAIAAGVPVLASDIAGNRGLLGATYPGRFAVGDAAALAGLLQQAMTQPAFLAQLTDAVLARRALVSPDTERDAIAQLIDTL